MTREQIYEDALKRIAEGDVCTHGDEDHEVDDCPIAIAQEALSWAPVLGGGGS